VFSNPPVIGNRPKVSSLYREFQYEGVICPFVRSAWRISRWGKNLNSGTIPCQEPATRKLLKLISRYLRGTLENRFFDLLANLPSLGRIERRTMFYGNDLVSLKGKRNPAGRTCKWQMKFFGVPVILAVPSMSDALVQKQPQLE
jgi:hypothetical protein